MTEWADGGYRSAKKILDSIRGKKEDTGMKSASVNESVRHEIMRRALEELENTSEHMSEKQTREMIIQTIVETRAATGQKVDMAQIEKMVERIGNEIDREEELTRRQKEQEEQEKQRKEEEKRLRKENQMPWYWWVVIALVCLPFLIPILRILTLALGRAGKAVF